jgi:beta-1,4-mannosyl-glycoprotein beta-1,4-N-acetylglucosaminyltransferase
MKIVDSFIFNNELDILNYRLNLLYPYVDYFIICEAIYTHSGKKKPLYFIENISQYEKFKDKIVHLYVYEFPYVESNIDYSKNHQWENEIFHRNSLNIGYLQLNLKDDDIIIVSDLDEIINPNILKKIRSTEMIIDDILHLEMQLYYYNLCNIAQNYWYHSYIGNYKSISMKKDLSKIRLSERNKIIKNGGWHLSYFGDTQFIVNKLESFGHQEFNNSKYKDISLIEKSIQNNTLFWCNEKCKYVDVLYNDNLPERYQEFLSKFLPKNCPNAKASQKFIEL